MTIQAVRSPEEALADPLRNAAALKALAYFLGADLVGTCEAEPWMYYSHDEVEGHPIHYEQAKLDFTILLTVHTMNFLRSGRHRVAV